ncbi:hypothetical protein ACIPSE_16400 [Streptomyces sp. NPDC090106]|uniref:hypothetical protein n=1 Tax=Streptomyces sp. NPDC090106 TaxID=3365946 RepID=UPI003812D81E
MNLRLLALAGVAACAVALPLAVASAGQVGDKAHTAVRASVRDDAKAAPSTAPTGSPASDGSPLLLGLGMATAANCGPELTSPEGIEAQTCVLAQGEETWARTYYRNVTGRPLDAVLSFMGPEGRTVQIHCPVGAGDEPGTCETPRERAAGRPAAYSAVAEFAGRAGDGPLLLRSGSDSGAPAGSDDADGSGNGSGNDSDVGSADTSASNSGSSTGS